MAQAWQLSVDVAAPPDEVWALVGDPCGVLRWYRIYVDCETTDDRRIVRRADGAVLEERIVERDDAGRRYSYSVLSGEPLKTHLASFEVREEGAGSRVLWTTEAEPEDASDDLAARLAPRQREALKNLKALLEGG